VDYELDNEDEKWMCKYNNKVDEKERFTEDILSMALDILEKYSFYKSLRSTTDSCFMFENLEILQNNDCCVCLDGFCENVNRIVYCDGCNLGVHQNCYGLLSIPEGGWFCKPCSSKPGLSQTTKCHFCGFKGGAMSQTEKSEWVHIQCAFYFPEVKFTEPNCGGTILYKEKMGKNRDGNCSICHKNVGYTLRCSNIGCSTCFHVTCAKSKRIVLVVDGSDTFCWCSKHTPKPYRYQRNKQLRNDSKRRKEKLEKEKKN